MSVTLINQKFSSVAGDTANPNFLEAITSGYAQDNDCQPRLISQVYNYVRTQDGSSPPDLVDIANQIESAFSGNISPLLHTSFSGNGVRVREMDDPTAMAVESDEAVDDGDDGAGDRLPLYAAVTIRGGVAARIRGHTSKHYAPIPESHSVLDILSSGASSLWSSAITDFFNAIKELTDPAGNVYQLVMLRRSLCQLQDAPTSFTGVKILTYEVNEVLTTMRRRRMKRRVNSCPEEET